MTHTELINRANRWLLNTEGCGFVFSELVTSSEEIPDAIGWKHTTSRLVECKASRADFLSDKKKYFRKLPREGMGVFRYYMTPPGLIMPEDLPERWGLLYVFPRMIRKIVKPERQPEINYRAEMTLMCSALRRIHIRGDLKKIYDYTLVPRPGA